MQDNLEDGNKVFTWFLHDMLDSQPKHKHDKDRPSTFKDAFAGELLVRDEYEERTDWKLTTAAGQRYTWMFVPQGHDLRSAHLRGLWRPWKLLCEDTNVFEILAFITTRWKSFYPSR